MHIGKTGEYYKTSYYLIKKTVQIMFSAGLTTGAWYALE